MFRYPDANLTDHEDSKLSHSQRGARSALGCQPLHRRTAARSSTATAAAPPGYSTATASAETPAPEEAPDSGAADSAGAATAA